jgi:hypothetical protein
MFWVTIHRAPKRSLFPGAQWASGFNTYGLVLANPTGTVFLSWATITAVVPKPGFALVKTQGSRTGGILKTAKSPGTE